MAARDSSDTVQSSTLNPTLRQELHGCMRSMQETLVHEFASRVDACQQHFDEHVATVRHVLDQSKQQQNLIQLGLEELIGGLLPGSTELQRASSTGQTFDFPARARSSAASLGCDFPARSRSDRSMPRGRSLTLGLDRVQSSNSAAMPPIHEPSPFFDSEDMDAITPTNSFPLPGAPEHSEVEEERQSGLTVPRMISTMTKMDSVRAKEDHRQEWTKHMQKGATTFLHKNKVLIESERSASEAPGRPSSLVQVVEHFSFQWFCAVVIISTAVFEGYTADVGIRMSLVSPEQLDPSWFTPVSILLTTLYCVEVLCRLAAYRRLFLTGPDKFWNLFDLTLVLLSLLEYMQLFTGIGAVNFIRGLRLFRVLRVIRVFGLFRDLRLMICMISQSLWSLFWALLLLALILYLLTVIILQSVIFKLRSSPEDAANPAFMTDVTKLYGSLWASLFTLLGSITGGIDWLEATECLKEVGPMFRVLFSFFIFFTVIGVLNVLTGVFVERASELCGLDKDLVIQSQLKRNHYFLTEMSRLFKEANVSNTGTLGWDEFRNYLQDERAQAFFATQQLDSFDARTLFDVLIKAGGSGNEISMEEFIVGCQRLKGQARSVELIAVLNETRSINKKLRHFLYNDCTQTNNLGNWWSSPLTPLTPTSETAY